MTKCNGTRLLPSSSRFVMIIVQELTFQLGHQLVAGAIKATKKLIKAMKCVHLILSREGAIRVEFTLSR